MKPSENCRSPVVCAICVRFGVGQEPMSTNGAATPGRCPPPVPAWVVAVTAALGVDRFPASSTARTVNEYAVEAARPVTVAAGPVEVATTAEPEYTLYPATTTLSVEP